MTAAVSLFDMNAIVVIPAKAGIHRLRQAEAWKND